MVSWQTFVRLAFEVAESKGIRFAGIQEGGSLMQDLGDYWSENKDTIKQWTEQQARNWLRDNLEP